MKDLENNSWNLISGNNQQQHLDIDNIVDNIVFNGNLKLENKISAEMELTSLTPLTLYLLIRMKLVMRHLIIVTAFIQVRST